MRAAHFFWSGVRNWGTRLGSVVLFLVVARILTGHELGLFSATIAILAIAELVADNGIGDAVVQAPKIEPGALSAAFLVNLAIGLTLTAVLIVFAGPIARWFSTDDLAPLLRVMSFTLVLNAASYIAQSMYRREFSYRWLAVRALVATIISGALGVTLALIGFGAWSMVAQAVLLAAINCAFIWARPPFDPLTRPDFGAARGLLSFGVSLLTGRLLYYFSSRAIELGLLYRYGAATLSFYIIGSRLYFVLSQMITAVLIDVSFSSFSRLSEDRDQLQRAFLKVVQPTSLFAVPIFMGLGAIAPEACTVAFGAKGPQAAPYLVIVALFGALQVLQHFVTSTLSVVGRPKLATIIMGLRSVAVALILLPDWSLTPQSLVLLTNLTLLIALPLDLIACQWSSGIRINSVIGSVWPAYLAGVVMFAMIYFARPILAGYVPSPMLRGLVLVAIGASTYLLLLLLVARETVASARRWVLLRKASGTTGEGTG